MLSSDLHVHATDVCICRHKPHTQRRFLNYFIMLLQYIFERGGPDIYILASNSKDEWLDHVLRHTALIFHDVGFVVSVVGGRKDLMSFPHRTRANLGSRQPITSRTARLKGTYDFKNPAKWIMPGIYHSIREG